MEKGERIYRQSENSEKFFEKRLVTQARIMGCLAVKMKDEMNSGLPDRLIVMPDGRTVWVELKSVGKKPTALQASRIRQLKELGHEVFVVTDRPELEMVLGWIKYHSS